MISVTEAAMRSFATASDPRMAEVMALLVILQKILNGLLMVKKFILIWPIPIQISHRSS